MPQKPTRKPTARPAEVPPVPLDEHGMPYNLTGTVNPASIPAAPKRSTGVPTSVDLLQNILSVLRDMAVDIAHLAGRPE
jgi:hypothetical protein